MEKMISFLLENADSGFWSRERCPYEIWLQQKVSSGESHSEIMLSFYNSLLAKVTRKVNFPRFCRKALKEEFFKKLHWCCTGTQKLELPKLDKHIYLTIEESVGDFLESVHNLWEQDMVMTFGKISIETFVRNVCGLLCTYASLTNSSDSSSTEECDSEFDFVS